MIKDDYNLYFLNDLYDDEIIGNSISSFKNRLYYDILEGKKSLQNNRIQNGDIGDIVIDEELNKKYNMPKDTYSLHLNYTVVPFYSEKVFTETYGYRKPIKASDIMKDHKVFSKTLFFFICGYMFYDVTIVMDKYESIIFIPITSESDPSDFCKTNIEDIIVDENTDCIWSIMLTSKADFYMGYVSRSTLFNQNKIYLVNASSSVKYNKPHMENCWTVYITANEMSKNIMIGSNGTFHKDEKGEYIEVSETFKDYVYQNAFNLKFLIVNEPECSGNGIYLDADDTDPIFQIPYKKNPIPLENLIIWKYDNVRKVKLYPVEPDAVITYPNIYDFSSLLTSEYYIYLFDKSKRFIFTVANEIITIADGGEPPNKSDLYIEWIEPMEDISNFDSYIQDYIDCYGDEYTSMKENGLLPEKVNLYHPIMNLNATSEDYAISSLNGDYRAWRLDKLIRLLKDNPNRYDEIYNTIYYKNKKFVTNVYTYDKNPHIYERCIMDNIDHCGNVEENIIKFSKPHAYLHIYNDDFDNKPIMLYINGVRKDITHVLSIGSEMFIYFPASYIENEEIIQLDIELSNYKKEKAEFYVRNNTSEYSFENDTFGRNVAINDILFYLDGEEKTIIDKDTIDFSIKLNTAKIKFENGDPVDIITTLDTSIAFYDALNRLFSPSDAEYIVLQQSTETFKLENTTFHKKINLSDIGVVIPLKEFVNSKVCMTSTDFYQKYRCTNLVKENEIVLFDKDDNQIESLFFNFFILEKSTDSANLKDTYSIKNYCGPKDLSRIRVYYNGRLMNPNDYTVIFPNVYEGRLDVETEHHEDGDILVEYIGHDEEIIYNGSLNELMKDDVIYLNEYLRMPYNKYEYRVYIDGYRVPYTCISQIGQSSILYMNEVPFEILPESNIIIFKQGNDADPYDYHPSYQFLDECMKSDDKFKEYMMNKYKG